RTACEGRQFLLPSLLRQGDLPPVESRLALLEECRHRAAEVLRTPRLPLRSPLRRQRLGERHILRIAGELSDETERPRRPQRERAARAGAWPLHGRDDRDVEREQGLDERVEMLLQRGPGIVRQAASAAGEIGARGKAPPLAGQEQAAGVGPASLLDRRTQLV